MAIKHFCDTCDVPLQSEKSLNIVEMKSSLGNPTETYELCYACLNVIRDVIKGNKK